MSQNQAQDRRQSIEPLLPAPATESNDDYDLPVRLSAPLANMGLSYSTAKYIAPLSFLYVVPSISRTVTLSVVSARPHRPRGLFPVIPVQFTDPQGRLCCPKLRHDGQAEYVLSMLLVRDSTDDPGRTFTTSTPPLSLPNLSPS
jgi:hypothetical protein